jgi:bifunctional DNase/RNase
MEATPKDRTLKSFAAVSLLLIAFLSLSTKSVAKGLTVAGFDENELLSAKVHALTLGPKSLQHVVILSDSLEERGLPIVIGLLEANAIHSEMQGVIHRRPLTHDLLERIIEKADLNFDRIIITHLSEGIYYATIQIRSERTITEIDARPSDAIIMALKFDAPIFVSKSLFRDRSIALVEQPEEIEEYYGLTFQNLTPSLAHAFSFESTHGIVISDVKEGSHAEKAGLKRGDIVDEVGGFAVTDIASMRAAMKRPKKAVQARVFRKGRYMFFTLHPD